MSLRWLKNRRRPVNEGVEIANRRDHQAALEVIAGDKGEAHLGLDQQTWQRLAETVDLIVDPAALVSGVLPYSELFGPNVVGTAELIRIALTTKLKPLTYVSTASVGDQIEPSAFTEDADIRVISPTRTLDDSNANGYGNSKWASEVLLREANDLCGLPVTVFRCDMILADTTYRASSTPTAIGNARTSTGCPSNSSPKRSPRWVPRSTGSRPIT